MNPVAGTAIKSYIESNPVAVLGFSVAGLGAAVLSILKVITIVAGAGGAIFSLLAGYYTFRCWHRKWKNKNDPTQL